MLFLAVAVVVLAVLTLVGAVKVANALTSGAVALSEALNGVWTGNHTSDTKYVPLDEILAAQHLASGATGELVLDNEVEMVEDGELY